MSIDQKKVPHLTFGKIILSLIMFTLLWATVTDAWGISYKLFSENRTDTQKLVYDIGCRLIWVSPLIVLFRHYQIGLLLNLKMLFREKINFKILGVFIGIFTIYAVIVMFISHGGFQINPKFSFFKDTVFYLVVGIVEEFIYRGWGLNALATFVSGKKANVLSTGFFVLLHWPAYVIKFFIEGQFLTTQFIFQSVIVFIMGLLFGYVFRKNRSIRTPILLHAYFDWIIKLLGA